MTTMAEGLCRRIARAWGSWRAWLLPLPAPEVWGLLAAQGHPQRVAEPLEGTPLACADLRALAEQAHARDVALLADLATTGALGCAANRLGADVAVLALGEGLTALGLARVGARALPGLVAALDGLPLPSEERCAQARRAWELSEEAWRAASDAAQVVASYLRCHPRVADLRYPGLKTDPSFEVAARTLTSGFGPVIDLRTSADGPWRRVVCTTGDAREQVMGLERQLALEGS